MNKLAIITAYELAGFPLIPLKGKSPKGRNWQKTPVGKHTPEQLSMGNYGVVLRETDLVIDVDPRNFKPGDKPVSRLFADLKISAPKSFTVRTGGGGLHIYLTIPAGFECVNDLELYPGVEFKSVGRQVVGPGSTHPDTGVEYTALSGSVDIRVPAPQELLDLIKRPALTPVSDTGTGVFVDDAATQARFESYLKSSAEPSIQGKNGDLNAFKTAAHGRDLGLSPTIAYQLMSVHWNPKCEPPWEDDELRAKISNAYKYAEGKVGSSHPAADFTALPVDPAAGNAEGAGGVRFEMTEKGGLKKSFVNLLAFLKSEKYGLSGIFGLNEFTARVEFSKPAPWHNGVLPRHRTVGDNDLKMLKGFLAVKCKFEMPMGTIEEAVVVTAFANKFHPIRDYLNALVWDKTPRLNTWLQDYCGAPEDDYTRAVSRKVICAAVLRVFMPGCKFDHALVLEGEQGIGKSAICAILGGDWSGDFTVDPHNKDTIQIMQGKWIIELAELEITRRADSDALKAFISRQVDTARLAYGRLTAEFPRQSIFIATKNPGADGTYLKDDTGNRRWWPVFLAPKGGSVDFKGLSAVRDQIFAEALALVMQPRGERLDMDTKELKSAAREIVKSRHAEHEWTERIATWIEALPADRAFLTARDIFLDAMGGTEARLDRRASMAIATVMKTVGWEPTVKRFGTRLARGYQRPDIDPAAALGDIA